MRHRASLCLRGLVGPSYLNVLAWTIRFTLGKHVMLNIWDFFDKLGIFPIEWSSRHEEPLAPAVFQAPEQFWHNVGVSAWKTVEGLREWTRGSGVAPELASSELKIHVVE